MSQMKTWLFMYRAGDVCEGARRCLAYHERKTDAWRERELERQEAAKAAITMGTGYATVDGKSTEVAKPQYDDRKMQALYEAQALRKDHREQAERYRKWVNVLSIQPAGNILSLDYDDVLYFGLADRENWDADEPAERTQ